MTGLRLREAERRDSDALLRWRNDPAAVESSVTRASVRPDEHTRWLDGVLSDPNRVLLVAHDDRGAVGTVRFDLDPRRGSAEISINVAPKRRGTGLAAPLLTAGMAWIAARRPGVQRLEATIRLSNQSSLRVFRGLGFVEIRSDPDFTYQALELSGAVEPEHAG